MKKIIFITFLGFFCICETLYSKEKNTLLIKTRRGREYENAKILKKTPSHILISFKNGGLIKIMLKDLTPELQKKLGYNSQNSKSYLLNTSIRKNSILLLSYRRKMTTLKRKYGNTNNTLNTLQEKINADVGDFNNTLKRLQDKKDKTISTTTNSKTLNTYNEQVQINSNRTLWNSDGSFVSGTGTATGQADGYETSSAKTVSHTSNMTSWKELYDALDFLDKRIRKNKKIYNELETKYFQASEQYKRLKAKAKKTRTYINKAKKTRSKIQKEKPSTLSSKPQKNMTVKEKLGTLKEMLDEGLIGKEDYDKKKAKILSEF